MIRFRPPFYVYVEINWRWAAVYTDKSDIPWYCEWLVIKNATVAHFNAELHVLINKSTVLMGKRSRGRMISFLLVKILYKPKKQNYGFVAHIWTICLQLLNPYLISEFRAA